MDIRGLLVSCAGFIANTVSCSLCLFKQAQVWDCPAAVAIKSSKIPQCIRMNRVQKRGSHLRAAVNAPHKLCITF